MFKNLTVFRVTAGMLSAEPPAFMSCGATQQQSIGFVPVDADLGLLETVRGDQFARLQIETKKVPAPAIKDRVAVIAAEIERTTGRKPGRKQTKELKEQALLELLPMAMPTRKQIGVALISDGWLVLDTASASVADTVVTEIIKASPGLEVRMLHTNESPAAVMSHWLLTGEPAPGFTVDRECELKGQDEMKSVVRYSRHSLDIDEVRQHIKQGKMPTRLAMTFNGRMSFVLTDGLQLRKVEFLDGVIDTSADMAGQDRFSANAAIFAAEVRNMLGELVEALGGEHVPGGMDSAEAPAAAEQGTMDPAFDKAVDVVRANKKVSISLVLRHLAIGYNRAQALIEEMERRGIVSAMDAAGQRKIIGGAA